MKTDGLRLRATRYGSKCRGLTAPVPGWSRTLNSSGTYAHWILLSLCMLGLSACGTIPLPDSQPPLTEITLPSPGQTRNEVRRTLGSPDLLDTDRDMIYEWTADRKLAFALITPFGLPYGDVTFGQRFRIHVALDDAQRIAFAECSSDRAPRWKLKEAGCFDAGQPALRAEHEESFDLTRIPELRDAPLWHPEGAGAPVFGTLSPTGSLFAITDTQHTVWILDLHAKQVVAQHMGTPPRFWSIHGVPQPQIDFAADERQVVISQGESSTVLVRQAGRFVQGATSTKSGIQLVRYGCCPPGLIGLTDTGVVTLNPLQSPSDLNASRGRLQFGKNGAVVRQSAVAAPVRIVELDSATLSPVVTAIVGSEGLQHRVMDMRLDRARAVSPASFAFSPDGRWLIRNACRHVEWWEVQQLTASLERGTAVHLGPAHVAMLPVASDSPPQAYTQILEGGRCFGPIAFDSSGKLMAIGSRSAIHIWRLRGSDGTPFHDGGRVHQRLDRHAGANVVSLALDADGLLTAATVDRRGRYAFSRWRVSDEPAPEATK